MANIPVLLMNPATKGRTKMARRSTRRGRTSTSRRSRRTGGTYKRRSIRRRRNPSMDIKSVAFGAVAGAGMAAITYALDGVPQLTNRNRALAVLGGGLVTGVLVSMVSPSIGAGLAAAGVGIGGHALIGTMTSGAPASQTAPAKPATTTTTQGLGMLSSQLGALRSELGAVRAQLGAVYDEGDQMPAGMGALSEYDYAIG